MLLFLFAFVQVCVSIYFFVARTPIARQALYLSSAMNVVAQLILVVALYAPIFKLGAVV
jgi:hypothetical protein